jgi:hypothetical protein
MRRVWHPGNAGTPARRKLLSLFLFGGQAIVADAAYFGARNRNEQITIAGDLIFQLFVKMAFEFPDFTAAQAGDMNVVARAVGFVVMAIAAKVQQVKFINETMFFQKINRAVHGDQVDVFVQFLSAFEDLIDVEMLFGVVHHLENYAALARQANSLLTESFLEMTGGLDSIEAFAG